jgi:acetylornithine/succinyldiaminopimelate/putrescine aminotransferase
VTTAVANRVFEVISDPAFLAKMVTRGGQLGRLLDGVKKDLPFVAEVRGLGLLRGLRLQFDPAKKTLLNDLVASCQAHGLLVLRAGTEVLRFAPPRLCRSER